MLGFGRKKSKGVFQQPGFRLLQRLSLSSFSKGLLLVATCLIIAYLIAPSMPSTIPAYQIGDIADQNIRATEDVLVEDTASTANKQLENEEKSPSVYDFDANAAREAEQRLDAVFAEWRQLSEIPAAKSAGEEQRERFKEYLGMAIPDAQYAILVKQGFAEALVD